MCRLPFHMFTAAILLLAGAQGVTDIDTQRRPVIQRVTASVTIIVAERIGSSRVQSDARKQDRQVRQRDQKPLIEFY